MNIQCQESGECADCIVNPVSEEGCENCLQNKADYIGEK